MDELLNEAEALQYLLSSYATGGSGDAAEYSRLRQLFIDTPGLAALVPRFVRTCRDLGQFWDFIKMKYAHYYERRQFIRQEFQPLIEALEAGAAPSDASVADVLTGLDAVHIQAAWSKALSRKHHDPEGAITMARTLLESVCKCILDERGVVYSDGDDLPKLYRLTAESLELAPSRHTEQVFRQILGGCAAVVEGLGALRNRVSDAHGQGKRPVKPAARHAELAVNLAGAVAAFLAETWRARQELVA